MEKIKIVFQTKKLKTIIEGLMHLKIKINEGGRNTRKFLQ